MEKSLDSLYLNKKEPNKSCLLILRDILLNHDSDISETLKYGVLCFCYNGKMLFFLWAEKHLEDLILNQNLRQNGIGTLLFEAILEIAKKEKAYRMEWQVLDWNEPAIKFYDKYKTEYGNEWLNSRLNYEQLQSFN